MIETIRDLAGCGEAALMFSVAGLHVAWALGASWPARDEEGLVRMVIGITPDMRMPRPTGTLAVASAIAGGALVILMARGILAPVLPARWIEIASWGVVGVFLLRGVGGFFDVHLRPQIADLPYRRLNERIYSPLCLLLAALGALAI